MALRGLKHFWRRVVRNLRPAAVPPASDVARQLSTTRDENQALQSGLHRVQDELAHLKGREEGQQAVLQQQIRDLEAAGEAARRQVEVLETSLRDAAALQVTTAKRVETLEGRLEKAHREHLAARQEALVREQRQNRRLNLAMGVAGVALLLGTLAGVAKWRDAHNQAELLAELRSDIRDIKLSLDQRLGSVPGSAGEGLATLPEGMENGAVTALAETDAGGAVAPSNGSTDTGPGMVSPSYAFHPHSRHRSQAEMQAFFEENARQDGVISLSSGLQYKVLNRGIGRSPETSDTVVFDYRAYLPDGTELYNTYNETEPARFSIEQVVNPGLQQALQRMEEGAQWELYIPPALAYRGGTRKHRKHGFEPLIYVVELKSVIKGGVVSNEY
jgi:hypothetical protein